jgi:hypothetical protein
MLRSFIKVWVRGLVMGSYNSVEILVKDSEKAGLDPEILKQILINIVDPRRYRALWTLRSRGCKA